MSAVAEFGVTDARLSMVADDAYPRVLAALMAGCRHRCLCSMFIADLDPRTDPELTVDAVFTDLQAAAWRGVDVKLVLGGSRTSYDIAAAARVALSRARQLGIPALWLTAKKERGSHAKIVIADDRVLLGSHNWSAGSFSGEQTQDSLLIDSAGLAEYLASRFRTQWRRGGGDD